MRIRLRQLACDSPVNTLHHLKVRREEDIKVSLLDLWTVSTVSLLEEHESHTNGVLTGTVCLWYLVCTTGALIPGTLSGKV